MRVRCAAACALYLVAHGAIPGSAQTTNVSGEGAVQGTPAGVGYGVGGALGTGEEPVKFVGEPRR